MPAHDRPAYLPGEDKAVIDYVDSLGKLWGCARRRLDLKLESYPQSVFGRIQDGIPPCAFREQRFPELFSLEILRFNLAVKELPEHQLKATYIHYVVPLPVKRKLKALQCSRQNYYQVLSTAHRRIANYLEFST